MPCQIDNNQGDPINIQPAHVSRSFVNSKASLQHIYVVTLSKQAHDHELGRNKRRISEDSVFNMCDNPWVILTCLLS